MSRLGNQRVTPVTDQAREPSERRSLPPGGLGVDPAARIGGGVTVEGADLAVRANFPGAPRSLRAAPPRRCSARSERTGAAPVRPKVPDLAGRRGEPPGEARPSGHWLRRAGEHQGGGRGSPWFRRFAVPGCWNVCPGDAALKPNRSDRTRTHSSDLFAQPYSSVLISRRDSPRRGRRWAETVVPPDDHDPMATPAGCGLPAVLAHRQPGQMGNTDRIIR